MQMPLPNPLHARSRIPVDVQSHRTCTDRPQRVMRARADERVASGTAIAEARPVSNDNEQMESTSEPPCRHVSLANPRGREETNLPLLLRRVAELIEDEGIDPLDILDVTVSSEITENGPWWSVTVYWESDPTE